MEQFWLTGYSNEEDIWHLNSAKYKRFAKKFLGSDYVWYGKVISMDAISVF